MIDKVAGALPATGAAGAPSGASFKSALQGAGAKGAGFKAPAAKAAPSASAAKPSPAAHQAPKAHGPQAPQRAPAQQPSPSQVLGEVQRAQTRLDSLLKMAESGRTFSPAELLAFQTHAYRATQELDLASKVVEKGTSAVKQTLQTQL